MSPDISIIMATCNGGRHLPGQLESVIAQSCKDWQLIIRDDGSGDNTPEVIGDYARRYADVIKVIADKNGHVGASQNYSRLLDHADTRYIMFCDQDDIWLPDKIQLTLNKMKEVEERYGTNTPVLIHTDLKVVDSNLNVIAGSFWKYQHLNPDKGKTLNRLLVQNVITGSTVMINRALKDKIKGLPNQALMHDWWISLAAAAFGTIDYIPTATILYRQHGSNDIGAKKWGLPYILKMTRSGIQHLKVVLHNTQLQAKAFLDIFQDELTDNHIDLLNTYATLGQQSFVIKRLSLIKYGFFKIGFLRNIGLFLAI